MLSQQSVDTDAENKEELSDCSGYVSVRIDWWLRLIRFRWQTRGLSRDETSFVRVARLGDYLLDVNVVWLLLRRV